MLITTRLFISLRGREINSSETKVHRWRTADNTRQYVGETIFRIMANQKYVVLEDMFSVFDGSN